MTLLNQDGCRVPVVVLNNTTDGLECETVLVLREVVDVVKRLGCVGVAIRCCEVNCNSEIHLHSKKKQIKMYKINTSPDASCFNQGKCGRWEGGNGFLPKSSVSTLSCLTKGQLGQLKTEEEL